MGTLRYFLGRLSRNLWSKVASLPPHLRSFQVAMSESGPHHSWTADHLLSIPQLQLSILSHLSIVRIVPSPRFLSSSNALEYDGRIDAVATLKPIPKDVLGAIRGATTLTILECDWWSWKPEDVKALLERCSQLEVTILLLSFICLWLKLCLVASQTVFRCALCKTFSYDVSIHTSNPTSQALRIYTPRACLGTYSSTHFPSTDVVFSPFNACCFSCPSTILSPTSRY